jgi:hypothetical protein
MLQGTGTHTGLKEANIAASFKMNLIKNTGEIKGIEGSSIQVECLDSILRIEALRSKLQRIFDP